MRIIEGLPMQSPVLAKDQIQESKAWRISFRSTVAPGETPLLIAQDPRYVAAFAEPIAAETALDPAIVGEADGSLRIIWLPPSSGAAAEVETTWMKMAVAGNRATGDQRVVRAGLRTIRIVWSSDRAVICSAREQLDEALDAVVRFTLAERAAMELERQLAGLWPKMEEHIPLTHSGVSQRRSHHKMELAGMMEQATRMTASLLRLQTVLEQHDPALLSTSKRLYSELALQASVHERLEMLEDPLEFAMEHYELANTRLMEANATRKQIWIEAAVLVTLVAEFGLLIVLYIK